MLRKVVALLLVTSFATAIDMENCLTAEHRRHVEGATPLSRTHANTLSACVDRCVAQRIELRCQRVVFDRRSRSCDLFGAEAVGEQLVASLWHSTVAIDWRCYDKNSGGKSRSRRLALTYSVADAEQYSAWTAWTACSATCGAGTSERTRSCKPAYEPCSGEAQESKPCQMGPCSTWGDWTNWTPCSVTCGQGQHQRSRFCSTYYGCPGDREQQQECDTGVQCAQWQPWASWGTCSAFCGGGNRARSRTCTAYGACQGDRTESKPCNEHSCCAQWSQWSDCSVTCGIAGQDGIEHRSRRCTVDAPGAPGGYASEEESETRDCSDLTPCGEWSTWEAWADCTATCGGGEWTRRRTCSVDGACEGADSDTDVCHEEDCPSYQPWTVWTLCSVSCAGGTKSRSRSCSVTGLCQGDDSQDIECNTLPCPEWTTWGPWSHCSESCAGGWQKRGRVCNQYNLCPGDNKEKRVCNDYACPQLDSWADWGGCSLPCGGGTRSRSRGCDIDPQHCQGDMLSAPTCLCDGTTEEGDSCNDHFCAEWASWGEYGDCSASCGGGEATRSRQCNKDTTFCVGANRNDPSCICEGDDSSVGTCNSHTCPEWSTWGQWGECSEPCGGGAKERKRTCQVDSSFCTADNTDDPSCVCPGLDHSNDACNTHLCPQMGPWGAWGACSEPCGADGTRERTRGCQADTSHCQGDAASTPTCQCDGDAAESSDCNRHTCAAWSTWASWASCSASCDGGTQARDRTCEVDTSHCFGSALQNDPSCQCAGDASDPAACNEYICPSWLTWNAWDACTVSCGGGTRFRDRQCAIDPLYCVGDKMSEQACQCQGNDEDSSACNEFACPTWASWNNWNECSTTCGAGQRDRKRNCDVDSGHCTNDRLQTAECQCDGTDVEAESCDSGECFSWNSWQSWGVCSQVCGGGSRNRARECPQPGACPGLGDETDFCNQLPCPDWGSWGQWSSCSVTCGGGQRVRTRACPLEGGCTPGGPLGDEPCGDATCPIWAEWGEWSTCSRTCGEGNRERTRVCEPIEGCLGTGNNVEPCHDAACTLSTHWSEWSPCTQTCGGGVKTATRLECPQVGCPQEHRTAPCEEQNCPAWADWDEWTTCSKTCGGGSRTRQRKCEYADGTEVPRGCVGKAAEIDPIPCSDFAC